MSETATTLDQDFRNIVLAFCKRNVYWTKERASNQKHVMNRDKMANKNFTPERIASEIGYTNLDKIDRVFNLGQGYVSDGVKNRMCDYMRSVEPNMIVRITTEEKPTKN
jgi:hypothetical protein